MDCTNPSVERFSLDFLKASCFLAFTISAPPIIAYPEMYQKDSTEFCGESFLQRLLNLYLRLRTPVGRQQPSNRDMERISNLFYVIDRDVPCSGLNVSNKSPMEPRLESQCFL